MKKFSLKQLDHNTLWTPLLIIGIIGYIFLLYNYQPITESSLLESSLDGFLYQYAIVDANQYPGLHHIFTSPISMIAVLILELLLFYILFNDRKINRNTNIRALVIWVVMMILSTLYVKDCSSFWIGQIMVLMTIPLIVRKTHLSLLEMFFTSLLIGIGGLFYTSNYLFFLMLIFYAFEQRKSLTYSLVNILGIVTPGYLLVSYMWLVYDKWIYFPYILTSWYLHTDIFSDTYISILFIIFVILGYLYLFIKQFTITDSVKRLSKFLMVYYFISLILFFTEQNNSIAIGIITPALAILFIKNYKIK